MKVSVAYALPNRQLWLKVELPEGATVRAAIERCGLLARVPDLSLESMKVGIFGKFTTLDAALHDGDRVEVYRPLVADPKSVPKKAKAGRAAAESQDATP